MLKTVHDTAFDFLWQSSAEKRIRSQEAAVRLLFEKHQDVLTAHQSLGSDSLFKKIKGAVSDATHIFPLSDVQKEIYYSDTGSAVVPPFLKKKLLDLKGRFVVRPATLSDLQAFMQFAHREKVRYTIRAAGSWPFGGSIPMNNELVLDLSYLDFHALDAEQETLVVGPGAVFAKMRTFLKERRFALCQEITNPNSGTICGWVVTGGLGIGAYKYGHVRESVKAIFLIKPDGDLETLTPEDPLFERLFESEGQLGVVAGVVLKVKRETYVSKPYAFSFGSTDAVVQFTRKIREWALQPTSMIYFDQNYIRKTYQIQRHKHQKYLEEALRAEDDLRIIRERQLLETIEKMPRLEHVVVMEFDSQEDYERSLKFAFFNSRDEHSRSGSLSYRRLSVDLAHKLWEHRFAPVEMKQSGPSMLVSETILPQERLSEYLDYIQSAITNWTENPVKNEGHFLPNGEILIQSILLADTGTWRHQVYLGLVPFMLQTAVHFGGRPYGMGIWNLPFLKGLIKNGGGEQVEALQQLKKEMDPHNLINQCKFINSHGRKLGLRIFKRATRPLETAVNFLYRGRQSKNKVSFYSLGRLLWRANKAIFPSVVPPDLHAERPSLLEINSACAECDSCEKVCPTSDVFGMWGIGTPITRRKTANRLANGEDISQAEAMGFLVCTRCDNCTRVCPTDIPLTDMFDEVEGNPAFQIALGLQEKEKEAFVDRMWEVMKDSPLYLPHTRAVQKEERSHLEHGLKIHYNRGFAYSKLFIDEETCINCGMCAHENACIYGARQGNPRQMPELIDENCALCNACINFCPQNKAVQVERDFVQDLINNAVDMEEKKFWENKKNFLRDTTTIQRSPKLTDMADVYVTEEILMEIDKEASTGQIPVSGMGQGDRHMGIGFDAERFSHFHIVGPAQNRLHEGDPEEELSVALGRRHRYCKFDSEERLNNPPFQKIKLNTPILYNHARLTSNGRLELAFIKVAEKQGSLAVIKLNRILEYYDFFREEGGYDRLPPVIVPRMDLEMIDHLRINPSVQRELLQDLWNMPMFEITPHSEMAAAVDYIRDSVKSLYQRRPLICGYLEVSEYDIVGGSILPHLREDIEKFMALQVDVIHVKGLRNKDQYFVTSEAVRAIHHYLLESGRRHEVSLIASGGIRLASDSQKTIQRGAEATLIDFAATLALDPYAYKATLEDKTTTEKLMNLDVAWAIKRLNNQMESRKIQILEVLGASGFKDIKKTVGEEGRLIDFYELEERLQKEVLEKEEKLADSEKLNRELLAEEPVEPGTSPSYQQLKERVEDLRSPHFFYELGDINQTVYQRDHVWPGNLIRTLGAMAAGDPNTFMLKNVKSTGLLGDGFDVMKILYQRDPDIIPDEELNDINTALPLDKGLVLKAPWMFGGKSVGSIGLDTWRAHVIASRALGIQFDTGEGGYPTCFFLNRKGEPIFFTEPEMQLIKGEFHHDTHYTTREIRAKIEELGFTTDSHPHMFEVLDQYPELQPFLFYEVISTSDEPYISTELKTGLFGVTKETMRKARRVVIAYSQGAKMGIGGHILAGKVNKLVSYLRGIQGLEQLNHSTLLKLIDRIEELEKKAGHPLQDVAKETYQDFLKTNDAGDVLPELKSALWRVQQRAYALNLEGKLDHFEFENLLRLCEEVISYAYTSVISPFPFHNCYSIEDVKAFIDMVRMINPGAVVSVKVSPSVDIEFIAAGLARIARDNTQEALRGKVEEIQANTVKLSDELAAYAKEYGMKIEVWLDGPRGGTGASPNIIKGQMGMHLEYAIPLIHDRLVRDGLRNHVKFIVSGGIRTYEDVIKAVALGADGVIWGTAPLVAIGCDRNRNCHDGCSRGIATSNLIMQNLRNVDLNSRQMINAFVIMQMQVIRALGGLGMKDIRELRGRFDKIQWIGLKERVDFRIRQRREHAKQKDLPQPRRSEMHQTGQTNCGVAAVIGTHNVPSYVLDEALYAMKNRGMDGVGVGKTMCFPDHPHDYAYRVMVKGRLQLEMEAEFLSRNGEELSAEELRRKGRTNALKFRYKLAELIRKVFLEPYFDFRGESDVRKIRESYKKDDANRERDYREFGNIHTDPGDVFNFYVRVKPQVLAGFIENELLKNPRYEYVREYFTTVTGENYMENPRFIKKAEDFYVFNHSVMLTQALYVWEAESEDWNAFVRGNPAFSEVAGVLCDEDPFAKKHFDRYAESFLFLLRNFVQQYPPAAQPERFHSRARKIAAVMSCGKNFAVWKTAGREIPWETPASPNNIIHVRLATGSVVEQMNAHPFGKLHTALTHNGETTNYETLKQRVEQFGLPPLATTDTEVASLKFHLLAEELEYPDWALFESFSPTTGDDLALIPPEMKEQLEDVQRVEFTSSPDGPYQYLCLRHLPDKNLTERVDLKDPADLRPGTTAIWVDRKGTEKKAFSVIASEEQAARKVLELLDREGVIDGQHPDHVLVTNGMINRFFYDENGRIVDFQFIDRYGKEIEVEEPGEHYSYQRNKLGTPDRKRLQHISEALVANNDDLSGWLARELPGMTFDELRWALTMLKENVLGKKTLDGPLSLEDPQKAIDLLTYILDYTRTLNTGSKAKSGIVDIARSLLYELFDQLAPAYPKHYVKCGFGDTGIEGPSGDWQTLLVSCEGFQPEGIDPKLCLAAFLRQAYELGWRKFILYRVNGQRLISTAVMGKDDTDDVVIDCYGMVGEYFGAFMQGGELRCHGNAQNFCAMGIHHGNITVYGNAGKVCGYASKGGKVVILGDIVDRAWTNSVNDPRCQDLQVFVLGSASKYCGESLMGGDFFFGGMYFDPQGNLQLQERPYRGTKLLGGASRGNMLFFDPENRLDERQYTSGKLAELDGENWPYWEGVVRDTLSEAGVRFGEEDGFSTFMAGGRQYAVKPENFKLIVPRGGQKGYESH